MSVTLGIKVQIKEDLKKVFSVSIKTEIVLDVILEHL